MGRGLRTEQRETIRNEGSSIDHKLPQHHQSPAIRVLREHFFLFPLSPHLYQQHVYLSSPDTPWLLTYNCCLAEVMNRSSIQLLARKTVTQFRAVYFRLHVITCPLGVHLFSLSYHWEVTSRSSIKTQEQLKSFLQRRHFGAGFWLSI